METAIRVVAYIRVSSDSQHGADQDGAPRQMRAIAKYATKAKMVITETIQDLGVSGTTSIAQRHGLSKLLDSLIPPGILIIEKADRLARDLIEGELIIRHLAKAGWKIISAETGEDLATSETPTAILMRQLSGAIAEFDRRNIVGRLRVARERIRKEKGRCEGRKPFAGVALVEIKKLYRSKNGQRPTLQWIADQLNERGLPSATGKLWTRGTVHNFTKKS